MDSFEPASIKNFLPDDMFERVKEKVLSKNMGPHGPHFYHTVIGRWLTDISFDDEIESFILNKVRDYFNEPDLVRAGVHTARYQMQNGVIPQLWKHYDQSACQYSLDICIDKNFDWGIFAGDKYFDEEPNSCVIFSGNNHMHYRPDYPSRDENDYVTLLFMQFTKPDHWIFEGEDAFKKYSAMADFKFREDYGYWAQPDYEGREVCPCCDYRRVLDHEEEYQKGKRASDFLKKME